METLTALVQEHQNAIGLNPRNERNISRAKYPTHDGQRAHNPRRVLLPGCLAQEEDGKRTMKERGLLVRSAAERVIFREARPSPFVRGRDPGEIRRSLRHHLD